MAGVNKLPVQRFEDRFVFSMETKSRLVQATTKIDDWGGPVLFVDPNSPNEPQASWNVLGDAVLKSSRASRSRAPCRRTAAWLRSKARTARHVSDSQRSPPQFPEERMRGFASSPFRRFHCRLRGIGCPSPTSRNYRIGLGFRTTNIALPFVRPSDPALRKYRR